MGFLDQFFNKSKPKQEMQDYPIEKKLFPISKPWGYSPQHVENAIKGYTDVIEKQKATIDELREQLIFEKSEKEKLENEFRALQMQLNFVSVPSMSDIQEDYIQSQFENNFKQAENKNKSKASMISEEIASVDDNNSSNNFNPFNDTNESYNTEPQDSLENLYSEQTQSQSSNEPPLQEAVDILNSATYDEQSTEIKPEPKHQTFKLNKMARNSETNDFYNEETDNLESQTDQTPSGYDNTNSNDQEDDSISDFFNNFSY